MYYLKSLFFNFLAVFFANHILPGILVVNQTRLPHLGADLPFALILGFLNSLIYPLMKAFEFKISVIRLALAALVLNLVAYALVKILTLGIQINSILGYFLAAILVTVASFWTNYLEFKHFRHKKAEPPAPE